jgi:hypothetical protein
MREYVGFVNMNRELDFEIMEEINPLYMTETGWEGKCPIFEQSIKILYGRCHRT